jgi:hypothetical protein
MENEAADTIESFDKLSISTATIVAYSNLTFDYAELFDSVEPVKLRHVPLTKKSANVDKHKLKVLKGSIVSSGHGPHIKGLDMKKKKKVPGEKPTYFLHQTSVWLAIEDDFLIHAMIFNNCIKFAGCRDMNDAVMGTRILWEKYIRPLKCWTAPEGCTSMHVVFQAAMMNSSFKLGWMINRRLLNLVYNEKNMSKMVHFSQYESTSQTNVKIRFYPDAAAQEFESLKYPNLALNKCERSIVKSNPFDKKRDKKKDRDIIIIVFSTSESIITGKDSGNMRRVYDFFIKSAQRHRASFEEKLCG